ncbi:MAG: hypothetical protein RLZZ142_853 [Verrucomicrobiota bacterium]|jgi:hypothetical protein
MFFAVLLSALFGSLVLQHFLGAVPPWGARVFLMPVIFFYGALSLSTNAMLVLAFVCGFFWDILHVQWVDDAMELGVGWSVMAYAVLGALMSGLRPLFLRGRWEVHCLFSGVATSVLVALEYVMLSLRREPLRFEFSPGIWGRILGAGLVALVLSPLVFVVLGYLARLVGHRHFRPERGEDAARGL